MRGPRAPNTPARNVAPRAFDRNKHLPYELVKGGQGPGETPTPPGVRRVVQAQTRRIRLPKGR